MATISVIIPAYNIAKYISEALESALTQDPPFSQIIVVDDGSTDNTKDVVARYNDHRILYHYKENNGLGPARNTGLELATSEFIYFMDGDDVITQGMTKKFHELQIKISELDAFVFSALDFKDGTNFHSLMKLSNFYNRTALGTFNTGLEFISETIKSGKFPDPVWLYIFRKSRLNNDLLFKKTIYEDVFFTTPLMEACRKIHATNDKFYLRRVRQGSIMSSNPGIEHVDAYLRISKFFLDYANKHNKKYSELLIRRAHHFYTLGVCNAVIAKLGNKLVASMAKESSPNFYKYAKLDYLIGSISKKILRHYARLRATLSRKFSV